MEQELVTLTQPTADDIPLLAGGRLRIAHTISAVHDIHYNVRTIRNPNDDLQGITPSILHRLLTPTHSTLPQPFTFGTKKTPRMTRQPPPHFCLAENVQAKNPLIPCWRAAAGTNASAAGMMRFFTETKIPLTSSSIFSQAVSTIGEKNTISMFVANSGNTDMNNKPNIWQKIANHIDYYYWNPPPGYPPRWLNIIIFVISLYLWMFAWNPIKVKTTEILQISPENGGEVYLKENTGEKFGYGKSHMFTDWMRLEINQKDYWCICRMNFCPHGPSTTFKPPKVRKKLTEIKEIIIINKENCLVTKSVINNSKNEKGIELSLSQSQIKDTLYNFGPKENHITQKLIWLFLLFMYISYIYEYKKLHQR